MRLTLRFVAASLNAADTCLEEVAARLRVTQFHEIITGARAHLKDCKRLINAALDLMIDTGYGA